MSMIRLPLTRGSSYSKSNFKINSSFMSSIITKNNGADSSRSNSLRALALIGAGVSGLLGFSTMALADEAEHGLACPSYPWPHTGILSSYDHASLRSFIHSSSLALSFHARHNGQNYVFALLTGYRDPPAGVSIREGLHYNPYFPGGAIAMPKMLNDGAVEYEDGIPATEAQMGKDIVSFLSWAAEPEMEERKLMGFKWIFVLSLALLQAAYYRRLRWSVLKSRKLAFYLFSDF
ncbi:Cytochrome c1-2, heme protein, mitochondrial, partial [Mucuna pruriens]